MVNTTIDVPDEVWRIVKIRCSKEEVERSEALEEILREYIKDHGSEYGYGLEELKGSKGGE
jgi:metal-responsive CopG/Arc/MetJ family transcriptional regulator